MDHPSSAWVQNWHPYQEIQGFVLAAPAAAEEKMTYAHRSKRRELIYGDSLKKPALQEDASPSVSMQKSILI